MAQWMANNWALVRYIVAREGSFFIALSPSFLLCTAEEAVSATAAAANDAAVH